MAGLCKAPRALGVLQRPQIARQVAPRAFLNASSSAAEASAPPDLLDLEADSSQAAPGPSPEVKEAYKPWRRVAQRKRQLPGSRYQYHPPKYNRGPLHPIQSPPSSDPVARDFEPGPFNLPALRQTFESTVASDIMTLTYLHKPPGTETPAPAERLRGWDGSSPYHKNRARRGPRGNAALRLIEKDITFNNMPEIKEVTLAAYVPKAIKEPDHLLVARTMLMSITGAVPEITKARTSVVQWGIKDGEAAGVKTTIRGNAAYEFLERCIHFVFPNIKEWTGLRGSTGDSSGNLSWGFNPEDMALFPEIVANYDMYPAKMLPGCRVFVKTTATSDRQARLLFQALGIPFYGELRN